MLARAHSPGAQVALRSFMRGKDESEVYRVRAFSRNLHEQASSSKGHPDSLADVDCNYLSIV